MKGGHRKRHAVVSFTIHTLQLPKYYSDPFIVEYKRGDKTGMTERAIAPSGATEVTFEKRFRVAVTFYFSKRENEIRRKKIAFTVYRLLDRGDRKIFGKFEVDVSRFYNVTVPKVETIGVESPHSEKSNIVISFSSVATHSGSHSSTGNTMTEDNLTSLSEAMQLTTDRQEEWDVSETATPEARQAIMEFFKERERVKREHVLADFQTKAVEKRRRGAVAPGSRSPRKEGGGALAEFLSPSTARKKPVKRRKSRDEEPKEKQKEEKKELDQQSVTMLLRSVLIKRWCKSPISMKGIPKAASALFAALMYTRLFEEDAHIFEVCVTVIGDFIERYKTAVIIEDGSDMEKWYVSLCLLKLVEWQPGLVRDRVEFFCCEFLRICQRQFEDAIAKALEPLKEEGERIFGSVDTDFVVKVIRNARESLSFDSDVGDFFVKKVWCAFDGFLVDRMLKGPEKCTFGNGMMWNTALTIARDDFGADLPLFRECVSVLMMGAMLCETPSAKSAICEHLPNDVVLRILVSQAPDDFMAVENDTQEYCTQYNLTIGDAAMSFAYLDYEGNFSEIDHEIDCTRWIEATFDGATWKGFKFLQIYFKEEQTS